MAISHVCLQCGFDMARLRARVEPHYGLPLVLCPDCGTAVVRRKPRVWRTVLHVGAALLTLAVQLVLLFACLSMVIHLSIELGESLLRGDFGVITPRVLFARLAAVGIWLTVGFAHVGRVSVWLAFSGIAMVLLVVDLRSDQYPARLAVLVAILTVALAGIPLGKLTVFGWHRTRRALWRERRRRLRARSAVV